MPVHEIAQSKLAKMDPLRRWPIQYPAAKLVFGNIDRRHRPDHDVVQRDRDRGGNLIATRNPGHSNR